jgi:prolyl oligopeptidase
MLTTAFAQPSSARRGDQTDDYHGRKIADPYRWMEDLDSAETRQWVQAERAFTEASLKNVPERKILEARMKSLWNFERMPKREEGAGYVVRGGRSFFLKQSGLQNQPVLYVQDLPNGNPRPLIDVNGLAADGTVALSVWEPSYDGRYLAFGLAKAGSDWQEFQVRDVASGKDLTDKLEWIKFSSPAWSRDSKGIYYGRFPKPEGATLTGVNENQKLYYHKLGDSQSADTLVYERPDHKDWIFATNTSEDGRYLLIRVEQGTDSRNLLFYKDLSDPNGKVVELIRELFAAQRFLGNKGRRFYVQTTYNASRGRVVAIDLDHPERTEWTEVVPQTVNTLEQATMDGEWLVLQYLKDATGLVRVQAVNGGDGYDVPLPANASIALADRSRRFFSVASFTAPENIYDCGADGRSCQPLSLGKLPFDPSKLKTTQVFYPSKDGTKVPMFLVHRKGLALTGNTPTLLYAYGGFNISVTPWFNPRFVEWVEMGGVLAVANLRGGGEYGEAWHQAGMKQKKQTVFDDFISGAEWLIANKYTSPKKLAIHGGSNGGLLIGAVLNQRPDLFGAAIPAVGVMDMLRFHKFTIGAAWTSEYGSPDNPEDFPAIFAYSPLHNIGDTAYPPTMILTADHDDRVVPAHSFKYAATLQRAQKGPAPILIRIETAAGHGGGKPTGKRIEEDADVLAFLMKALGMAHLENAQGS